MELRTPVIIGMMCLVCACAGRKGKATPAGPTDEEIAASCAERACRPDTPQRIQVDATHVWEGVYPRSPYVVGPDAIVILPGEEIELAATPKADGTLDDLKVVPEGGAIKVKLWRMAGTKEGLPPTTMLMVSTTFDRPLHYCAYINIPGVGRVKTSIIGVGAGISGTETWMDPIIEIILTDLRLTETRTECR
ncbi:MAG: hypothetical protein KC420_19625 [Myxococcales bacterium]|nr:hypothetical protein [Myxococcales bacterium]MCB9701854.1 hypothetical protein [Myxococcales bacterium]